MTKSGTKDLFISSASMVLLGTHFLSNRKQRVVLNGQHSSWAGIKTGVPQGSILGPRLFLVYISDLTENLHSNSKNFADDTYFRWYLFSTVSDKTLSNSYFVRNKAKGRISKRVIQEYKARQIFRKANITYLLIPTRTSW